MVERFYQVVSIDIIHDEDRAWVVLHDETIYMAVCTNYKVCGTLATVTYVVFDDYQESSPYKNGHAQGA